MNAVLEKPPTKSRAPKAAPVSAVKAREATVEPAVSALLAVAPAADSKRFTEEQLKELYQQTYNHMECAYEVLIHYAQNADDDAIFALRDLLDVYLEQAKDRLSNEEVGSLSSGDLPDLSCDLARMLALLSPHATLNDDGVLHGVDYLLSSAKRIADGDLGVLT